MPELIDRLSLIDKLDQGQKKALDAKDFTSFFALVFFKAMLQNEPEIHAMNTKTNGEKMPELIDRQAALEIAMSYCLDDDGCCSKAGHDVREMLDEIEALPTIEPEVRHGRWIPTEYDSYADGAPVWDKWECSECGHEHNGEEDTLTAFCSDCGTKMDGGADNETD